MILCRGIRPDRILTLTYTVAATRDMEARFRELLKSDSLSSEHCGLSGETASEHCGLSGETASEYCGLSGETVPEFRTINGISAKIIQYYGKLLGKQSFILLKDEKEKLRRLSAIYRKIEENYATESELHALAARITYIKNGMLSQDEINELEREENYHLAGIYHTYLKELRAEHLMDYDDQMRYAFSILKASPETLSHCQKKYPYLCVDEAQDTSLIQHKIIALLARKRQNIFMVGDEDQSIYGFRAAYPEALTEFSSMYPNARILLMEDNFRSDENIVAAADRFIQRNTLRHPKKIQLSRMV
jgi:DNA helicase-2/ATP-dependent DNA helicase PcrA